MRTKNSLYRDCRGVGKQVPIAKQSHVSLIRYIQTPTLPNMALTLLMLRLTLSLSWIIFVTDAIALGYNAVNSTKEEVP